MECPPQQACPTEVNFVLHMYQSENMKHAKSTSANLNVESLKLCMNFTLRDDDMTSVQKSMQCIAFTWLGQFGSKIVVNRVAEIWMFLTVVLREIIEM